LRAGDWGIKQYRVGRRRCRQWMGNCWRHADEGVGTTVCIGDLGSVSKRLILPIVLPDDMEVDRHEATRTHGRAMGIDPASYPV
jgi:hypothetical protein